MFRGLLLWLIIMVLETVHGILRGVLLVPRVGEMTASRISWPVGMVLVLAVAVAFIRWSGLRRTRDLLLLGAVWAVLTGLFEVGIGLLRGYGPSRIWTEINPAAGGLMLASLIVMFLAPWAAARLRHLSRAD